MEFTQAQRQAMTLDRHVFVEAGAGSGKTTLLVHRYLSIFEANPDSDITSAVAFTFSRKASFEMTHRVGKVLATYPKPFQDRWSAHIGRAKISTIHAYCIQILREFGHLIGIDPGFKVMEGLESKALIDQCITDVLSLLASGRSSDVEGMSALRYYLSYSSSHTLKEYLQKLFKTPPSGSLIQSNWSGIEAEMLPGSYREATILGNRVSESFAVLYDRVRSRMRESYSQQGALSFDQVISELLRLLTTHPAVLAQLRSRIKYVMVDEFQDTDPIQWEVISTLTGIFSDTPTGINVFVVGDVKQAIYGFRGADVALFTRVQALFQSRADCECVYLTDNFRSTPAILSTVNEVFEPLFHRLGDTSSITYHPLVAHREPSPLSVDYFLTPPPDSKGHAHESSIADHIHFLLETHPHLRPDDIAILIRGHKQSPQLQLALDTLHIPSVTYELTHFYREDDVQWVLNGLKVCLNPQDTPNAYAFLTHPFVGITDLEVMQAYALFPDEKGLLEKIQLLSTYLASQPEMLARSERLKGIVSSLYDLIDCADIYSVSSVFRRMQKVFLEGHPLSSSFQHLDRLLESNRFSLLECVTFLEDNANNGENLKLSDEGLQSGGVHIMTIHSSKGLEFPVVIIPYCHQKFSSPKDPVYTPQTGLTLKSSAIDDIGSLRNQSFALLKAQTIEEEKRLFYVACTRAKEGLYLFTESQGSSAGDLKSYADFIARGLSQKPQSAQFSPHSTIPATLTLRLLDSPRGAINCTSHDFWDSPRNTSSSSPSLTRWLERDIPFSIQSVTVSDIVMQGIAERKALEGGEYRISPNQFGTMVHRVFYVAHMTRTLPSPAYVTDLVLRQACGVTDPDQVASDLLSACRHYLSSDLFADLSGTGVYFEHPFSVVLPSPDPHRRVVCEGRFDAVKVSSDAICVVDFKSNRQLTEDIPPTYLRQLTLYLLAARALFGPRKTYSAMVYYTQHGQSKAVVETDETLDQFFATGIPTPVQR